ncbi:alpha/beta fold hydrolase [Bacillus cytotoxicus]|uniref:Carboxylesterase n=1 Tax=Bacillus cytotoxicus (strain DSM 22905 / CIP 110041 / 391-98 / NVH 391-98) TaxID=315749 RepID=A7GSE0_BACCN|nr:alpha/beta hydrolase [Bacillus cytotoxicus]ABS23048.1 Carboxylesterase [Bacillus cytotoxicus NVH 391-98]AWC33706.1 transporter [Bacillus cytotoxicus]AWC37684.1 transporter [Bacillus cytotoxicus]AWC45678.1 transporter [Bacillus cytotoxicus]AWC61906.1 transporter [Bacillus cytotoxicus]
MKQLKLIFIPGWGMEKQVWSPILSLLQESFAEYIEWHDVKEINEFAKRVEKAAEGYDVILIGWSLGALVALEVCNNVKTKGMILISSTAKFTVDERYKHGWKPSFVERMKRNIKKRKNETLSRFYISMFAEEESAVKESFENMIKEFQGDSTESLQTGLDYLMRADMRERLKDVNVPMLLLHGEQDSICPLPAAHYIKEKTNATLKVIHQAGHAICITNFEYCANEINKFIEGIRNDQ